MLAFLVAGLKVMSESFLSETLGNRLIMALLNKVILVVNQLRCLVNINSPDGWQQQEQLEKVKQTKCLITNVHAQVQCTSYF
jgi:hypothetical protein